jgi:catalase
LQGIKNLTSEQAAEIQAKSFNHATQDLYEHIKNGEFPQWELCVQIMSDDEHVELDFDPLDDTKIWPTDQFPFLPVGKMTLNKNPENYFAEVEQAAFGTGVLVDGLDFSDDKMLQGRTFSYSDTQRYRVGPNYLQLPINSPKGKVATNQRDGQMTYHIDLAPGANPHVNYEPSTLGGLHEAQPSGKPYEPEYHAKLVRRKIERQNNFKQAGERFHAFEDWEREDLINNILNNLKPCAKHIQDKMIDLFTQCDAEYGRLLAEGIAMENGIMNDNGQGNMEKAHQAVTEAEGVAQEAQAY